MHNQAIFQGNQYYCIYDGPFISSICRFKGLTRGDNIRILRNCSNTTDYDATMTFLKGKFKKSGISNRWIDEYIVKHEQRQSIFTDKSDTGKNNSNQFIPCISPYNRTVNLDKILEENWGIFST